MPYPVCTATEAELLLAFIVHNYHRTNEQISNGAVS